MERRDTLKIAASGALLAASTAFAQSKAETKASSPKSVAKPTFAELSKLSAECSQIAQVCAGHCFKLLRSGNTMLAECAQTSLEISAVSSALTALAGFQSVQTADQAKVCIASCEQCIKACEPHAGHHKECKDCLESCKACLAACKAYIS
jgi:Cys-rich four helix bundle protein (predicted Tat secretion target)